MNLIAKTQTILKMDWAIYLIASLLIWQFLFFIDEGYNSFFWMQNIGNWLIYSIYTLVLFATLILLNEITSKFLKSTIRRIIVVIVGLPLILALIFKIM